MKLRRIFRTIIIIFISASISLGSSFLIKYYGIHIFRVETSSMEPVIKVGSLIFIKKSGIYRLNDIVTYKTTGMEYPITHRIVFIRKTGEKYFFILKGDKNNKEDPYVISQDEIVGKLFLVIPYIGKVPNFLFSYQIIWFTVYLPSGILIGRFIRKLLFRLQTEDIPK